MSVEQTIEQDDFDRLIAGTHWNPHSVLGPHVTTVDNRPHLAIRAWLPNVTDVEIVSDSILRRMIRIREEGLYEALLPDTTRIPSYLLRITQHDGTITEIHDYLRVIFARAGRPICRGRCTKCIAGITPTVQGLRKFRLPYPHRRRYPRSALCGMGP